MATSVLIALAVAITFKSVMLYARNVESDPVNSYESLGCWKDNIPRAISSIDEAVSQENGHYKSRSQPLQNCLEVAKAGRYKFFALQDGGQCFGSNETTAYKKYGASTACSDGKGGPMANNVYEIRSDGVGTEEETFSVTENIAIDVSSSRECQDEKSYCIDYTKDDCDGGYDLAPGYCKKLCGVLCNEAMQARLVGGSNELEGTVEVHYNGTWGTICGGTKWDILAADVICKMLGHKRAISAPPDAHFGRGTGEIILGNVYCKGTETNIGYCNHDPYGKPNRKCSSHSDDAGVVCSSDDRYEVRKNAVCSNIQTSPYYQGRRSLNFSEATNLCDNDASCAMVSGDARDYSSFHLCDEDAKINTFYTTSFGRINLFLYIKIKPQADSEVMTTTTPSLVERSIISSCVGTSDFNQSLITSPNYPNGYGDDQNCWWRIWAEEGQIIELKIEEFELEYSSECTYDWLQAYDGTNSSARTLLGRKLCGSSTFTTPDKIRTEGPDLYLEFHSDISHIEKGFKISYTFKDGGCLNDAGYQCQNPFEYGGKQYRGCTTAGGYSKYWCYDVRGNGYWDYCTNSYDWSLVAEKKKCEGGKKMKGNFQSIEICADECRGVASMFIFSTNEFGDSICGHNGCECWCEMEANPDGSCNTRPHVGYKLYKFI